jgi:hypothetical protein
MIIHQLLSLFPLSLSLLFPIILSSLFPIRYNTLQDFTTTTRTLRSPRTASRSLADSNSPRNTLRRSSSRNIPMRDSRLNHLTDQSLEGCKVEKGTGYGYYWGG